MSAEEQAASTANASAQNNLPTDGTQWVELFVTEMMSATSVDDARGRAAKVLEVLEKSIRNQATAEAAENFQKVDTHFGLILGVVCMILASMYLMLSHRFWELIKFNS